jgi:hypothetical protein
MVDLPIAIVSNSLGISMSVISGFCWLSKNLKNYVVLRQTAVRLYIYRTIYSQIFLFAN